MSAPLIQMEHVSHYFGEGALRVGGKSVDYYNIASASFGFQIGAQQLSPAKCHCETCMAVAISPSTPADGGLGSCDWL